MIVNATGWVASGVEQCVLLLAIFHHSTLTKLEAFIHTMEVTEQKPACIIALQTLSVNFLVLTLHLEALTKQHYFDNSCYAWDNYLHFFPYSICKASSIRYGFV